MKLKIILCLGLLSISSLIMRAEPLGEQNFSGWAISNDLFLYIVKTLDKGKTILEIGSGFGTGELAKYYKMYSVEHDKKWLNQYNSTYIYASIKHYTTYNWYDITSLKKFLPKQYDMILIDGPTGEIGRYGFFKNLHLFNTEAIMIFDDIHREAELNLLKDVAHKLKKSYQIYSCSDDKQFGVINER